MNWIENLLIIAGISLELFAAMACHGAMVAKIEKKSLTRMSLLVSLWQFTALYIGNFLSYFLIREDGVAENEKFIGSVIATLIFLGMGIRLGEKAVRNESIYEHREDGIRMKKFFRTAAAASVYTLLAGIAFGFFRTNLWIMLACILVCSVAAVVAGTYTGYHFGFEQKRKAYGIGALFLFCAGLDVIVRHILRLF